MGSDVVDGILNAECKEGNTVKFNLKKRNIQLIIEPGRSLLDQSGITAFRVNGLKKCSQRGNSISIQGSSFSLSSTWFGLDFLVDPMLLVSKQDIQPENKLFKGFVTGSTCSQTDVISWRNVELHTTPNVGDLLVYINTAGYEMDFIESNIHRQNTPMKLAVSYIDNELCWTTESNYQ